MKIMTEGKDADTKSSSVFLGVEAGHQNREGMRQECRENVTFVFRDAWSPCAKARLVSFGGTSTAEKYQIIGYIQQRPPEVV